MNYNLLVFVETSLLFAITFSFTRADEGTDISTEPPTFRWCSDNFAASNPAVFQIPENLSEGRIKFTIRLHPGNISCSSDVHAKELFFEDSQNQISDFSSSGFFRYGKYYYPPEAFCIASWTKSSILLRVCGEFSNETPGLSPECDSTRHCIPKCCPMNMLLTSTDEGIPKCLPRFNNSARVNPTMYGKDLQKSSSLQPVYYFVQSFFSQEVSGPAIVKDLKKLQYFSKHCYRIMEDGALSHLENYEWIPVPRGNYCLDGIQSPETPLIRSQPFLGKDEQYTFMLNYSPEKQGEGTDDLFPVWFAAVTMSASIFPLINFLVYLLLWEDQRLPGWIAMSVFATLFLTNFLAGLIFLFSDGTSARSFSCVAIGVSVHFFCIARYSWLTMICFKLFWSFKKLKTTNEDENKLGLYMRYAGFGWGFPLAFVTMSLILDQMYSYDPCNQVLVPQYGVESCFISTAALGPYLLYPEALLLSVNLIFFSYTTHRLYGYSKSIKIAKDSLKQGQEFFNLIAKLFVVMGLTWIIDFIYDIVWFTDEPLNMWYWGTLSAFVFIQSFAVFFIYTCKASVYKSLNLHYPLLQPVLNVPEKIRKSFYSHG
ncbi:unnamed protein product [Allacma fusca]|uniref:G-protein coupled receptors family 2 profile 2 domain-containing protein n=1 Tax=Allacma fusca TaxID=39272 RepID=A0A8J2J2G2_9HEXA|nr:unnamed protein product [Allacma fusca]